MAVMPRGQKTMQGPHWFHAPCPHRQLSVWIKPNTGGSRIWESGRTGCVWVRSWTVTSSFGVPTSQFEFHSAVVDECPVNPVAEGFKGSDAEHSWLLLPQVLIGSPPERVLSKYTARDWKGQTVEIKELNKSMFLLTTKSPVPDEDPYQNIYKDVTSIGWSTCLTW